MLAVSVMEEEGVFEAVGYRVRLVKLVDVGDGEAEGVIVEGVTQLYLLTVSLYK